MISQNIKWMGSKGIVWGLGIVVVVVVVVAAVIWPN